jgi:hypothetical protein
MPSVPLYVFMACYLEFRYFVCAEIRIYLCPRCRAHSSSKTTEYNHFKRANMQTQNGSLSLVAAVDVG